MRKNIFFVSLLFPFVLISMEPIPYHGPSTTSAMSSVLYSDDQTRIIALNRAESLVQIYEAKDPFSCIKSVENGNISPFLTSSALAKNVEDKVAAISYGTVTVRDLATLAKLLTLSTSEAEGPFYSINFNSKKSNELASCYGKTVAIWDIRSGEKIETFISSNETNQVQFSSDGTHLAFCNNSESRIFDLRNLKQESVLLPAAQHLAFNKTGSQIALAKNALIKTFDSFTGKVLHEIDKKKSDEDLYSLAYSNDGKWLMYGTSDFELTLACLEDEAKTYAIKDAEMLFCSGEFNKDDTQLLTGAVDLRPSPKGATVRIWDLPTKNTQKMCSIQ